MTNQPDPATDQLARRILADWDAGRLDEDADSDAPNPKSKIENPKSLGPLPVSDFLDALHASGCRIVAGSLWRWVEHPAKAGQWVVEVEVGPEQETLKSMAEVESEEN